jgi:hypothetical protein
MVAAPLRTRLDPAPADTPTEGTIDHRVTVVLPPAWAATPFALQR